MSVLFPVFSRRVSDAAFSERQRRARRIPTHFYLFFSPRPQSVCGMREPEARSYNTTAGRVGVARRRRERLVAVCVGREPARAMSKTRQRLAKAFGLRFCVLPSVSEVRSRTPFMSPLTLRQQLRPPRSVPSNRKPFGLAHGLSRFASLAPSKDQESCRPLLILTDSQPAVLMLGRVSLRLRSAARSLQPRICGFFSYTQSSLHPPPVLITITRVFSKGIQTE